MTRDEQLKIRIMEECAEVAQRISKLLIFGEDEIQDGQSLNNRQRLMAEFTDLVAVMEMAGYHPRSLDDVAIAAKKRKVEKYLAISQERGILEAQ